MRGTARCQLWVGNPTSHGLWSTSSSGSISHAPSAGALARDPAALHPITVSPAGDRLPRTIRPRLDFRDLQLQRLQSSLAIDHPRHRADPDLSHPEAAHPWNPKVGEPASKFGRRVFEPRTEHDDPDLRFPRRHIRVRQHAAEHRFARRRLVLPRSTGGTDSRRHPTARLHAMAPTAKRDRRRRARLKIQEDFCAPVAGAALRIVGASWVECQDRAGAGRRIPP